MHCPFSSVYEHCLRKIYLKKAAKCWKIRGYEKCVKRSIHGNFRIVESVDPGNRGGNHGVASGQQHRPYDPGGRIFKSERR